ncbi:hypothetical protein J2S41_004687 [Catenuloplanes atrovinosus]|uniref:Uncharacterized protein n=1 Tax=Catenuloplanes atrovinosus TaxID=137266 RepID=A0AAE3YQE2_9ACTN|nr:hypothetical protein [Catenuloplanes atrovinosus]
MRQLLDDLADAQRVQQRLEVPVPRTANVGHPVHSPEPEPTSGVI